MKKNKEFILIFAFFFIFSLYPLFASLFQFNPLYVVFNRLFLLLVSFYIIFRFAKLEKKLSLDFIDKLFLLNIFFIISSLLVTFMIGKILLTDLFKELLFTILPLLLFIVLRKFNLNIIKAYSQSIFFSFIFITSLGLLQFFNLNLSDDFYKLVHSSTPNFQSYYGAISFGYFTQLVFALVLFDIIKVRLKILVLITVFIIVLLTLQRSAYLGIVFSFGLFLFAKNKFNEKILFLSFILLAFIIIISLNLSSVFRLNYSDFIIAEIESFSLELVLEDRITQNIITNNKNFFNILFGLGFGLYSRNNSIATLRMPDATFLRIFNELGFIGFILFFLPYLLLLTNSIKQKNFFQIYLLSFTLFASYFNPIIIMIPSNFAFFIFASNSNIGRVQYN